MASQAIRRNWKRKSFRKDLQISSKKFDLAPVSDQDLYRFSVAEHDELACVLYRPEPASPDFPEEPIAADKAFHVADLPPNDSAFSRSLGRKHLHNPAIRGQFCEQGHAVTSCPHSAGPRLTPG
jgi:hypothetical protein